MTSGLLSFTGPVQRLASLNKQFSNITFWGYNGFSDGVPVDNSSSVFVGIDSSQMPIKVTAGASYSLSTDSKDSLYNYYASGASGDGLVYYAW